jgi:hypothetical protein
MTLSIDPFAIGNNNFKIVFTDLAGDPIGIKSAQMKFNQIEEGITHKCEYSTNKIKEVSQNRGIQPPGKWEIRRRSSTKPTSKSSCNL